jgi:2'-5' RNA ligase
MYYGLVHFPKIDIKHIDLLRKKYDPTVDLIQPHITIMFPVPDEVGEAALVQHIERVLKPWKPIPIRTRGFHKSWDHWLFLTLEEGNPDV